ncbi:MAG: metal-dependent hydrolase [Verrucomicrobiota bacterium]
MDPVSQATAGALVALALSRPRETGRAFLLGAVAGAAPDLDILIESASDPLLGLEYHRHFTHSLLVAPMIGLLVVFAFRVFPRMRQLPYRRAALYGIAGSFSHGLLDACTSYGTRLYWPFSQYRESWDTISVIDPIFTIPLILLVLGSLLFRSPVWSRVGLLFAIGYLSFGFFQRERAASFARDLAASRGHVVDLVTARPSFANLLLWRIVYESEGIYHVDAVSLGFLREPVLYEGGTVGAFSEAEADQLADPESVLADDIERFRHFSQGFLYRWPDDPEIVGDLRYAMMPDSMRPLWGIRLDPSRPEDHVSIEYFRELDSDSFQRLWDMIRGRPVGRLNAGT